MISFNLTPTAAAQGSGLDVTAVVDQILYAESAPERLWQAQQAQFKLQATALTSINGNLSSLKDKVNALKDVLGALSSKTATSSLTSVLTASAQPSASSGVHQITVTNLATTSSYYTDALASGSATFATGSFSLQVGSGAPTVVTVDATNNTLDGLAAYLNGQNLGVTASVINDANGARLALVSKTSGAPGDLAITGNTTGLVFQKSVTGTNAALTVDGVPISSASNTVSTVISGVTLNLLGAAPGSPVTLTVGPDTAKASQAVNDFVAAYNAIISAINTQFTYNEGTKTAGPLAANSSLRSLQASLLSDATYSISGNNDFVSLATVGVNMADDGTLSVDSAKLNDVLANHFADLQNFFQSVSADGFARHFGADLTNLTDATQGLLNLNLTENTNNQRLISDQIADFDDRLAARRKILIDQYSRVDTLLRQFPLIQAQITGQLGTLQNQ